jgi:carboxymethylenebutenolidase
MIRVPEQWRGRGHGEPLDGLRRPGACPVLAIIGEADPWTPATDVAALEELENVTVVRYPGAEHGFVHDPDRPAHRPDDAADAWRRAVAFLS